MKKKWWIIGLATQAIAGGFAVVIPMLQPPRPGVTKANFNRIELGMAYADVEAKLGKGSWRFTRTSRGYHEGYSWSADDGAGAHIWFCGGKVEDKRWHESTESVTDTLRRWLCLPRGEVGFQGTQTLKGP